MQKPMKSFHVYLTSKDSPYKVVETTGCNSVKEVNALLPPNVNWYGVLANSPEEAVALVESTNFRERYREPGEINALKLELDALRGALNDFRKSECAPPLKAFHKLPPIDDED